MSTMIPYDSSKKLPAHLRADSADSAMGNLSSGLDQMGGFPVMSIRGSKWRIKVEGEETALLDKNKNPIPSINFVVLGANEGLAKNYYDKPYVEGSDEPPKCWSLNGAEPDPGVEEPVSKTCQRCPMNVWGSKITQQGKKTRACSDTKRLAIIMAMDLALDEPRIGPALLRVPAASLAKGGGSLRALMREVATMNVHLAGVIVRASFDVDSDYPKINFAVAGFLGEDLFAKAQEFAADDIVERITGTVDELTGNEPKEEDDLDEETSPPEQEAAQELDEDAMVLGSLSDEEKAAEEESEPEPEPKRGTSAKKTSKKAAAKKAEPEPSEFDKLDGDDPFANAISEISDIFS